MSDQHCSTVRSQLAEDGGAKTLSAAHHLPRVRSVHQHHRLSDHSQQSEPREEEVPGAVSTRPELGTQ